VRSGAVPFHEPGLPELVEAGLASGKLHFTADPRVAVTAAQVVMVAVGTHDGNGGWQTRTMIDTLSGIVPFLADDATLVVRSTLPPDFIEPLKVVVRQLRRDAGRHPIPLLLNPEFTREGQAVHDFLEPDRIVFGIADDPDGRGAASLARLYRGIDAPVIRMSAIDACLSKLGANLFLATKISFANELALLADTFGGDVNAITRGMSYDARIGGSFLRAGIGFGGSCLPNQVTMTVRMAQMAGIDTPLVAAVAQVNARQRSMFVDRIRGLVGDLHGTRIALLGLAFKPDTDDLRDAPSLDIARELVDAGASVVAYDPMSAAMVNAAARVPGLELADSVTDALTGADVVALVTEWPVFTSLDWVEVRSLVRRAIVVDGRNAFDPATVTAAGFAYASFGRDAAARVGEAPERAPATVGAGLSVSLGAVAE
jgi:UDPglucose 6-dehydrogenase